MNRTFQQAYHVPGTLAANLSIVFKLPFDVQLVHVSANSSADSDATVTIGNAADADAYLQAFAVGDEDAPAEVDRADFVGGQFPHIPRGTTVVVGVDFDGTGGTAADDLTLVLTFTEG